MLLSPNYFVGDFLKFLWLFDILLLCYFNLNSSIVSCLFSGDIILSLRISLSYSFVTVSVFLNYFLVIFFKNFCNSISNFITNQITSCFFCFLNDSFWRTFKCICCRLFSMIKKVLALFTTEAFTYIFTNIFTHIFSKRQISLAFYKYSVSLLNWISRHFLYFILQLTTKVMFILSSTLEV